MSPRSEHFHLRAKLSKPFFFQAMDLHPSVLAWISTLPPEERRDYMVQLQLAFSAEAANSAAPTASVDSLPLTAVEPPTTPLEEDSLPEESREWAPPDAEELAAYRHQPREPQAEPVRRSSSAQPKSHHEMSLLSQNKPMRRSQSLSLILTNQLLKIARLSQSLQAHRCKHLRKLSLSNNSRGLLPQHSPTQHRWSSQRPNHHQPDFHKSLHTRLPGQHQQPHHQPQRHQTHRWPSRQSPQSLYAKPLSLTNKTQHRTAWCSLHLSLQPYLHSTWITTNSLLSSSQTRTIRIHTQPLQRHQPRCQAHSQSHHSVHQDVMSGG